MARGSGLETEPDVDSRLLPPARRDHGLPAREGPILFADDAMLFLPVRFAKRTALTRQPLQFGLFLGDLPAEIPALKLGQLGREQPAIALNITPMRPHSGSSIVDLHPFPQDGRQWAGRRQEKPRPGFGGGVSRRAALRAGLG
jgi:hypothetical protein